MALPSRSTASVGARKDYKAIAAAKIRRPSQVASERRPAFLIYARNKKGKTRFCTTPGQGKVLIIDPEHGTDLSQQRDPDVWHIESWEDMDDIYKFLRTVDHGYEWVALDGLTRMANMALRFVMAQAEEQDLSRKPGMVNQRDYGKSGELMKSMLYNFHNLPVGVIYTAQERQVEGSFGEEDEDVEDSSVQYVPDLPKGVRGTVNGLVDVIGRLYTVKIEKEGKQIIQRRLWLEPNVAYDTGYRSDYVLPAYLKVPTVPKLVQLINEGKVTSNG